MKITCYSGHRHNRELFAWIVLAVTGTTSPCRGSVRRQHGHREVVAPGQPRPTLPTCAATGQRCGEVSRRKPYPLTLCMRCVLCTHHANEHLSSGRPQEENGSGERREILAVACKAFTQTLAELAASKQELSMDDVVTRLAD